jgi:hypothetical protein
MRGRLELIVRDPTDRVVASRSARNTVMRAGAGLVAQLFAGRGTPITHMGVGTSDADPDSVDVDALRNEGEGGEPGLEGATVTPIATDAFAFEPDDTRRLVRVRLRATLPAEAAVGTIREGGLLATPDGEDATATLYNRVTFAPLPKGADHELTMFWEVEFPFGDLQWL